MKITFKNATSNDVERIFQLNSKIIKDYGTSINLNSLEII